MASFSALSLVLAYWSLRSLNMLCETPHAVHRGEPMMAEICVENRKWLLPAIAVRIENSSTPERPAGFIVQAPARRTVALNVSHVFERRGVQVLPPFDLVTVFPFGLLEWRRRFPTACEVVVYPRISPLRAAVVEQMAGRASAVRSPLGTGDEFFSLREYIHGDDIRKIAWRVSARAGKWMIRETAGEGSRHIVIALDTREGSQTPEQTAVFEDTVDMAASLAVTLLNRQYEVSLITPDRSLDGAEGTHQQKRILELLARVQPVRAEDYPGFDGTLAKLANGPDRLLCISAEPERWGAAWNEGRSRVLDPREAIYA